ncbi:MAG: hypothetical protein H6797_02040 [Candidatus Nomurabacteria bacterium]|nr:MAG: hypothetical protein H6797_02040 [Candidatus Nomurabacteria bacterium]
MQNLVIFFALWPVLSLFVAAFFTGDEAKIVMFFLRSLELSGAVLTICIVLHLAGIVHSTWAAAVGAVVWGGAALLGEYAYQNEQRDRVK